MTTSAPRSGRGWEITRPVHNEICSLQRQRFRLVPVAVISTSAPARYEVAPGGMGWAGKGPEKRVSWAEGKFLSHLE